jgi:hypothetical protein
MVCAEEQHMKWNVIPATLTHGMAKLVLQWQKIGLILNLFRHLFQVKVAQEFNDSTNREWCIHPQV